MCFKFLTLNFTTVLNLQEINISLELAVKCVKSICENTQCIACDKLIGPCVRFPCGHWVCDSCVERTRECLLCVSSSTVCIVDKHQSNRLSNTFNLLTAFQDTFNIDVYKRQRISDQLKVEKLVFPECIQAPYKYSNKRKSFNLSITNKENIFSTFIPGEEVSCDSQTMKKSHQYVQNWLKTHEALPQNQSRRPFGNINLNTQTGLKNRKKESKQLIYRKGTHIKSIYKTSSLLSNILNNNLENENLTLSKGIDTCEKYHTYRKCDKNESGIDLDDDVTVIEGNKKVIDKDDQAWLDVLKQAKVDEKENKEMSIDTSQNRKADNTMNLEKANLISEQIGNESHKIREKNVLFFKRSSTLIETCKLCSSFDTQIKCGSSVKKNEEVSIVINNSSFVTTIQITHEENRRNKYNKRSVSIQTDGVTTSHKHKTYSNEGNFTPHKRKNLQNENNGQSKMLRKDTLGSFHLLATCKKTQPEKGCSNEKRIKRSIDENAVKPPKCLIIDDSDTESNRSFNNTQEVEVEVHRSEYEILRTLSKTEYLQKSKRCARGNTPNSSNSSDKENLDPNRNKVVKLGKKNKNKKHI